MGRWDRRSGRRDRKSAGETVRGTVDSAAVSSPWRSAGCSKLARARVSAFSLSPSLKSILKHF